MNNINKQLNSNAFYYSDRRPGYSAEDAAQLVAFVQQLLASPAKVLLTLAGAILVLVGLLLAG